MADRTHACPGQCGQQIPRHRLACNIDWSRLPAKIRLQITSNYRRNPDAHFAAVRDAVEWYAANPREASRG